MSSPSSPSPEQPLFTPGGAVPERGAEGLSAQPLLSARLQPEAGQGTEAEQGDERSRSAAARTWRAFAANRLALIGLCVIVAMAVVAAIGPLVYAQSATEADIFDINPNAWPSTAHLLGTDKDSIDILARLLAGMRVSLGVAVLAECLNVLFGVPIGLAAGYFGGWLDFVLSRIADVLFAFPGLLLAILVTGVFGPGVGEAAGGLGRLGLVTVSLALVGWPLLARYVRAEVLSLKERDYVEAALALGASRRRIMWSHIMPNVVGLILTVTTLDMAGVVVSEATLSLLGLGVQPPYSSIGLMISNAIGVLNINWTESLFPGLVLTAMVLCFSFVGDGLRDALDPRTLR